MQPINKDERRKAFWNFLLLFVICIIIITTTIFFSTRVPFKQNEQLVKEMSGAAKEREFSDKFMNKMSDISAMLDTINTKETKPDYLDGLIKEKIVSLGSMVNADSGSNKINYNNAVLTLEELRDSKKQLRDLTGQSLGKEDLKTENKELLVKLHSAKSKIIALNETIYTLTHPKP